MRLFFLLLLTLWLACTASAAPRPLGFVAASAGQATFYVSPGGSASNTGTSPASPLTVTGAQAAVRAYLAAHTLTGSVIVYLRGGTYFLTAPLALTSADSGNAAHPVLWQAYPGEKPVLSGGLVVTGWTLHDAGKNIWQAAVSAGFDTRTLYVNGARCSRVHSSDMTPLGAPPASTSSYGITYGPHGQYTFASPLPAWGNTSQIEFVYDHPQAPPNAGRYGQWPEPRLHVTSWSGSVASVAGPAFSVMEYGPHVTQDQSQVAAGHHVETSANGAGYDIYGPAYSASGPGYIANAYELFSGSQPGQFYLSKTTSGQTAANTLYYQPRAGEDMMTARVVAASQQALLTLTGASYVTFQGIQFSDTTWLLPNTYGLPELQTGVYPTSSSTVTSSVPFGQWAAMPGAVQVHGGAGVSFTGCTFRRLGAAGISVDSTTSGSGITGCTFTDISGNGIELGGLNDYKGASSLPGSAAPCSGLIVANNYLHDFPTEFHGCVPILKFVTQNSAITHNLIRRCTYDGIADGLGWSSVYTVAADAPNSAPNVQTGNAITWNDIGQTFWHYDPEGPPVGPNTGLFYQTDGGNLYTNGQDGGLLIAFNYLHDVASNQSNLIYCDNGEGPLTITGNVLVGGGSGNILAQDGFGGNVASGNWSDNANPLSIAVNGSPYANNQTGPTILPGDSRINGTSVVQTATNSVTKGNYYTVTSPVPAFITSQVGLEAAWRFLAPASDQGTPTNSAGAALSLLTAPSPPPALALTVAGTTATATVSWAAPRFVGAGIGGFTLLVNGVPVSSGGASATSLTYDDLQPSTAYTFGVQAFGTDGAVGPATTLAYTTGAGITAKTSYTTYKAAI